MRWPRWFAIGLLAVPAAAGDDGAAEGPQVEGAVRAGWRFVEDEGDGRYLEDHGLLDGPRLFDLRLRAFQFDDPRLDEVEGHATGLGDPRTDYGLALRRSGSWEVETGHLRDDFSYRATGDPFPYDTIRERTFARAELRPAPSLRVHLRWDRSHRRGDAFLAADTDLRPVDTPPPVGVDPDIVRTRRPLDQRVDHSTVGVDWGAGNWRAGLTQSLATTRIDDERYYDVPPARRDSSPVREALRRQVRSKAWTTAARAGVTLPDLDLDVNGFYTFTRAPSEGRVSGSAAGFDNAFAGGSRRGDFTSDLDGRNRLLRHARTWRVEAEWRPLEDVELVAAGEHDDRRDDASLHLVELRRYDRVDVEPRRTVRAFDARITDRSERASLDAFWDAAEDVRLRLGEEYHRQDLSVPTETHLGQLGPTGFDSDTFRTTAGIDVEPLAGLDLSLLVRRARNNHPQATPGAHGADEVSFRGRCRVAEGLFLTTTWRRKDYEHDRTLDSTSRSDSVSVAATWTSAPLTVSPSVTWQEIETRTDTTFLVSGGGPLQRLSDQVRFTTRDLIASLDARLEVTSRTRLLATGSLVDSDGDYAATWLEAALGAEHDVADDVTLGVTVRRARLDEEARVRDDYDVTSAEVYVELRF